MQRATVSLLNAIYEQDFLDCSYGFRAGRGAHEALDEVGRVICQKPTAYVLELDIYLVLRLDREGAAHGDDREADERCKHPEADGQVDQRWRHR